ncbi:hypothetical protein F0562_000910 [Nyssa sinensis]|uniref:Uncharacterized protein n=1 Tax=Nyssa sinensis TaxID=561372 RepID=A0A5J5C2S2_9ASTE|nr:hypothetical protein F0562_000910 [Nyssa sinensis]
MTPHEERLVLELHAKWGNRWSRIARKLPGRTDNEIKNYWRTHMRKKAQESKRAMSPSSPLSNSSSSSANSPPEDSMPITETKERSFYDTGGLEMIAPRGKKSIDHQEHQEELEKGYSMDEIWKDIALFEDEAIITPVYDGYGEEGCDFSCQTMASPLWDYCPHDSLWMQMDDDHSKMVLATSDQFYKASLTG